MSRYIEYHDICSAIDNQQDGTGMTYEALAHAMVEIQIAPSIDVVRCRECKHCYVDGEQVKFNACELNHNKVQSGDWFCADGERREP